MYEPLAKVLAGKNICRINYGITKICHGIQYCNDYHCATLLNENHSHSAHLPLHMNTVYNKYLDHLVGADI